MSIADQIQAHHCVSGGWALSLLSPQIQWVLILHGGKRINNNKSPTSSLVLIHRLSRLSLTTHYLKRPLSRNLVTYLKMDRKPWLVCTHYHNAQLKFVVVTMFRHAFFPKKPLHKQCLVFRHKVLYRIIPSSLPHIFCSATFLVSSYEMTYFCFCLLLKQVSLSLLFRSPSLLVLL